MAGSKEGACRRNEGWKEWKERAEGIHGRKEGQNGRKEWTDGMEGRKEWKEWMEAMKKVSKNVGCDGRSDVMGKEGGRGDLQLPRAEVPHERVGENRRSIRGDARGRATTAAPAYPLQ